jgi:hypothetical protein
MMAMMMMTMTLLPRVACPPFSFHHPTRTTNTTSSTRRMPETTAIEATFPRQLLRNRLNRLGIRMNNHHSFRLLANLPDETFGPLMKISMIPRNLPTAMITWIGMSIELPVVSISFLPNNEEAPVEA